MSAPLGLSLAYTIYLVSAKVGFSIFDSLSDKLFDTAAFESRHDILQSFNNFLEVCQQLRVTITIS